jgi:hypothetical protein
MLEMSGYDYLQCEECGIMHPKSDVRICPVCGGRMLERKYAITHNTINYSKSTTPMSEALYFLPIFFGIIGGIIGYMLIVDKDRKTANNLIIEGLITTVLYWIIFGLF